MRGDGDRRAPIRQTLAVRVVAAVCALGVAGFVFAYLVGAAGTEPDPDGKPPVGLTDLPLDLLVHFGLAATVVGLAVYAVKSRIGSGVSVARDGEDRPGADA